MILVAFPLAPAGPVNRGIASGSTSQELTWEAQRARGPEFFNARTANADFMFTPLGHSRRSGRE
jgi:hypothetical protein